MLDDSIVQVLVGVFVVWIAGAGTGTLWFMWNTNTKMTLLMAAVARLETLYALETRVLVLEILAGITSPERKLGANPHSGDNRTAGSRDDQS